MAYNALTDFLALVRKSGNNAALADMPGLDYIVAALARMGFFTLSVGQDPPLVNQPTTVWIKPSLPSWVAEGVVYLYNSSAAAYEVATPELWAVFLASQGADEFQSVVQAAGIVASATTLLAIERTSPSNTVLVLPSVQLRAGRPLQVVDWSSLVTNHTIGLTPAGGETIMKRTAFQLRSSADQLAGVSLYPSENLNGWVIAP